MGAPCQSACTPWATDADVCSPCDDYTFPIGLLDDMLAVATDVLYELSGRRFPGSCQDVVRPCATSARTDDWRDRYAFADGLGRIRNGGGCSCAADVYCGCARPPAIQLGVYPVTSIVTVKVDGVTLDASRYRIDDYRWLVRLSDADGTNPGWPCCQDLTKATTEDDTFEVTFTYGVPPPPAGVTAAARLACELALMCSPETIDRCRLPKRVTQITRQGITALVLNPNDFLSDGRTGIYEVDLFVRTYNPNGMRRPAAVWSPDTIHRARRVGT